MLPEAYQSQKLSKLDLTKKISDHAFLQFYFHSNLGERYFHWAQTKMQKPTAAVRLVMWIEMIQTFGCLSSVFTLSSLKQASHTGRHMKYFCNF